MSVSTPMSAHEDLQQNTTEPSIEPAPLALGAFALNE